MGLSFNNIHLRRKSGIESDVIAAIIAEGRGWKRVDDAESADIVTAVCGHGEWVTIASDVFDGDIEVQLDIARKLSAIYGADALAIGCFDSDYLFMNLINDVAGTDIWAATGSAAAAGLKGMRRSDLKAWRGHVSDAEAFATAMRKKGHFAEDCL